VSIDAEHYFYRLWLPEIIGYAEMIVRETDLRNAWVKGDKSRTSAYYPGELVQQIHDLTGAVLEEIAVRLASDAPLIEAIENFLGSVDCLWFSAEATMDVETWGKGRPIANAESIFKSREWLKLQDDARQLVVLANAAGFRSNDHE
jgi:hypothetical protein